MKRILPFLLILTLFAAHAQADPLPLKDDYANVIRIQFDESDPSAGSFEYSYRYPHVDEEAEGGMAISTFYQNLSDYLETFTIPMDQQNAVEGENAVTAVTYEITCNNDDFFSVLIRKERSGADRTGVIWEAHVFSRKHSNPDNTYTLPKLLEMLSAEESDEWLQERQTNKANKLIREMVWDMMQENKAGIPYYEDYQEEYLEEDFEPEQDFYLDENGDPVFFINPGYAAPESAGLLIFPIPLEDILDEL